MWTIRPFTYTIVILWQINSPSLCWYPRKSYTDTCCTLEPAKIKALHPRRAIISQDYTFIRYFHNMCFVSTTCCSLYSWVVIYTKMIYYIEIHTTYLSWDKWQCGRVMCCVLCSYDCNLCSTIRDVLRLYYADLSRATVVNESPTELRMRMGFFYTNLPHT